MRHHRASRRHGAGFTYVALLLAVALLGVSLAWTGEAWRVARQREQERQLLFVGRQIRDALLSYANSGSVIGQYPRQLEDLLEDPRRADVKRHLRRIYPDPLTGQADWVLITNAAGEVLGVHSRSLATPLKRANFAPGERAFEEAESYAEWRFAPGGSGGEWRTEASAGQGTVGEGR